MGLMVESEIPAQKELEKYSVKNLKYSYLTTYIRHLSTCNTSAECR